MTVPDWGRNLRRPLLDVAVLVGASAFLPLALDHAGWFPGGAMPGASAVSKALRVVSLALLVACAMPIDPRRWRLASWLAMAGVGAAVAMFVARVPSTDSLDGLFWNGAAVVALIAVLLGSDLGGAGVGLAGLEAAVVLQAAVSLGLSVTGHLQSDNGGWVGGAGNANGFAFLCLVVIARRMFDPAARRRHLAVVAVAAFGVVASGSLFGALGLVLVASVGLVRRTGPRAPAAVVIGVAASLVAWRAGWLGDGRGADPVRHMAFKAWSLVRALAGAPADQLSRSVELRGVQWRTALDWFATSPASLLVGGVGGSRYYASDSQVLTYVASFGLPVAAALLAPVAFAFGRLRRAGPRFAEFACLLALVAGFLVVNRCFDYFSGGAVIALLLADACRAGAAGSAAVPARP